MNNMLVRALSGAVYVALIVLSLIFSPVFFALLCVIFGILAVSEFSMLTASKGETLRGTAALDIFGIICLTVGASGDAFPYPISTSVMMAMGMLWLLYVLARMCVALYQHSSTAMHEIAYSILGQIYIGVGLLSASYLSFISPGFVLLLFILIWLNDTGAYLTGRTFGRHKLFERLSPKKTWEGFAGGVAIAMIVCIVLACTGVAEHLVGKLVVTLLGKWGIALILPVIACIFSTLGDLFESMIKRSVGAKDSGRLIPGHGGLLDRIDSMLFVMPSAALLLFFALLMRH